MRPAWEIDGDWLRRSWSITRKPSPVSSCASACRRDWNHTSEIGDAAEDHAKHSGCDFLPAAEAGGVLMNFFKSFWGKPAKQESSMFINRPEHRNAAPVADS